MDFYTLEVLHVDKVGVNRYCIIDGDSPKWWNCNLNLSGSNVIIAHTGKIYGSYNLTTFELKRANGVDVQADTNEMK